MSSARRRPHRKMKTSRAQALAAAVALLASLALAVSGCGEGEETSPAGQTRAAEQTAPSQGKDGGQRDSAGQGSTKGEGDQAGSASSAGVPTEPVETTGIPKAPKGGDDSIQTYGDVPGQATTNEIAGTMNAYFAARLAGHWKRACDYTTPELTAPFEAQGASCPQILEGLTANVARSRLERPSTVIGGVRSDGEHAFVIFEGRGGKWMVMALHNDGGRWGVMSPGANRLAT